MLLLLLLLLLLLDTILKTPIKKEIVDEKSYFSSYSIKNLKSPNIKFPKEIDDNITPKNQKYTIKTDTLSSYKSNSSIYNDNSIDLSSSPTFYTPPSQAKAISIIGSVTNKSNNDSNIKLNLTSLPDTSPSLKFSKK